MFRREQPHSKFLLIILKTPPEKKQSLMLSLRVANVERSIIITMRTPMSLTRALYRKTANIASTEIFLTKVRKRISNASLKQSTKTAFIPFRLKILHTMRSMRRWMRNIMAILTTLREQKLIPIINMLRFL